MTASLGAVGATPTDAEAFAEAVRCYAAGQRSDAEKFCDAALAANPDHAGSLHLLGVIAHQSGQVERAVELLTRAAALNDGDPVAQAHLGKALTEAGRMEAARERFERTLELKPDDADAHLELGNVLARLGRVPDALAHFQAAAALRPDNAEAHNNLGFALNTMQRHEEAIDALERALAIVPDYPEARNNLGNALLATGAVADSIACYRAALRLRPDYVNALSNLGNALFQSGRYEDSCAQFERALVLDPQSPTLNNGLGNALQKLGRWREAMACYERALALRPDYADAWTNLAAACNDGHLHDRALACCDKALAIDPGRAEAFNNRGIALTALDCLDQAMDSYAQALALNPRMAMVYANIGSALAERGRVEEALANFDRAIAIEPTRPQFHLSHVLTKRVGEHDPRLATLEALARDAATMPDEARIDLQFALAKAYADVGRHNRAFSELLAGNALKRRHVKYDEAATLGRLERIAQVWSHRVVEGWSGRGHPSARPIFILGMPRSGSTLVEQILASHPSVAAGGEMSHFEDALTAAFGPVDGYLPADEPDEAAIASLGQVAERYLAALAPLAPDAPRITDKMPANFAWAGLIHLALPNARIIHTRRDALDTCLSCFSTLFTAVPYSYDLGELGRYYRAYHRLMAHWRDVLPESAILEVDYENLVADLETQARRIVAYCGLPWDDGCLSFHESRQSIKTASAVQVRQPLYRTSVGRWRDIAPDLLRPLRAALGEADPLAPSPGA